MHIEIASCTTRTWLQDMGAIPREGIPSVCLSCPANLPETECGVVTAVVNDQISNANNAWGDKDEPIAY